MGINIVLWILHKPVHLGHIFVILRDSITCRGNRYSFTTLGQSLASVEPHPNDRGGQSGQAVRLTTRLNLISKSRIVALSLHSAYVFIFFVLLLL
jgi:hypothetical protein